MPHRPLFDPLIRAQRSLAIVFVSAGMLFLGISYYRYGLAAQSSVVISMIPMLFAGLLLGRAAVWITAISYLMLLMLGAWVDVRNDTYAPANAWEALSPLVQPGLSCAIVALILDRLILKSESSDRRMRDIALICRQLQLEIREKKQSQAQLVHAQKMDALAKLASGVTHDFNNLLGIILGYANQAMNALQQSEVDHCLSGIESAAHRGRSLTQRLLGLARRNGGYEPMLFDAREAILELGPLLKSVFDAGIALRFDIAPEPALVRMDRSEFDMALLNIARNANDALSGSGEFRISAGVDDHAYSILLADTGHGMLPEVMAHMFDPFFTTKPHGHGTGIGLAVVYRTLIEAHGRIDVDSEPGDGCRIRIRLPLAGPGPGDRLKPAGIGP